jgi:hypothetical protein
MPIENSTPVPSTSALPTFHRLQVPAPDRPLTIAFRRAEVRAFWILVTAALSLVLTLAAAAFSARAPWAWGVVGLALPLPALIWPPWLEIGVRAWNKCVRSCAVLLRAYVLRVGYYLMVAAVGRAGSSMDLGSRNAGISRWISRSRHDLAFGDCDRQVAADGGSGGGFLAPVRSLGKAWQLCLLPVLLLLSMLRDAGQESAVPSSTYTLY